MSGNKMPVPNRDEGKAYRLERSVLTAASQINLGIQESCEPYNAVLLTLTYRNPDWSDWSPNDIRRFMTTVRNYLKRKGSPCRYVWVCELQKRGAPHYHVIFWLPPHIKFPKPDDSLWWTHGLTRIETAKHPVGYLVGYAKKNQDFSGMPKGVRVCGYGGLTEYQRKISRWWKSPNWLKKQVPQGTDIHPAKGGGWVDRDTGEWFPPEWSLTAVQGRLYMVKRTDQHLTQKPDWNVEYIDQKVLTPTREECDRETRNRMLARAEISRFMSGVHDRRIYLARKREDKDMPPFQEWMSHRIAIKQSLRQQNTQTEPKFTPQCITGSMGGVRPGEHQARDTCEDTFGTGDLENVRSIGSGNSRFRSSGGKHHGQPVYKMISQLVDQDEYLPDIDLDYDPYA